MRQIPVRELNQHPFDVLTEAGEFYPAQGPLPLVSRTEPVATDSAGLEELLADRYGDSRW